MVISSRFVQFSVWIYLICLSLSNPDVNNFTLDRDSVDGDMLVNLGKRMEKPLLTLIGMTIRNQHPCSEWAQWTSCTARLSRQFGTKKRTRLCSTYKMPEGTAFRKTDEDLSVCVGSCPSDYYLTVNGNCFKFYGIDKSWNESENTCKNDGGHLVSIESDAKFNDVKTMVAGVNGYIWIDGRRKNLTLPWETIHGDALKKVLLDVRSA